MVLALACLELGIKPIKHEPPEAPAAEHQLHPVQ
jgi:hypothetical protein